MGTTLFSSFAFNATGGNTPETLPDRLAVFANVKDFGAKGDGITDDTQAIQSAVDFAFGPASNPNGTGHYKNKKLFFPNGTYNISSPIVFTQVEGAHIYGAGKLATRIVNTTTSGSTNYFGTVFLVNSNIGNNSYFTFAVIEHLTLAVSAPPGSYVNSGFNHRFGYTLMFRNVRFEGGDVGINFGASGSQSSEIQMISCDFVNCAVGTTAYNYNALNFTLMGGSFQNCGVGVWDHLTSPYTYISGVHFSGSSTCDIKHDSYYGTVVEGCYSTSTSYFMNNIGDVLAKTKACMYKPATPPSGGYSICNALLIMDGCVATNCVLNSTNPWGVGGTNRICIRGCSLPTNFLSGAYNVPTIAENI